MTTSFPKTRMRRLRENLKIRYFLSETRLYTEDLVQPLFVKEGLRTKTEISSMPGQFQHSEKSLIEEARELEKAGIPAIILFGIPARKDTAGKYAHQKNGITQRVIRNLKRNCKHLLVIADVCLCEYLSHGHCGHVIQKNKIKSIDNDSSLKTLSKIALSYADAGADILAPSDMMDGRVHAIRRSLDKNGYKNLPILSYAVKYASAFYGPFREAAQSAPSFGDRKSYQMNAANSNEALLEARLDLSEGADFLMVKPALSYLDVLQRIKNEFSCPVGAYSVSGEYSMICAAASKGWLDEKRTVIETHLAMKRAGANFILTYWAKKMASWADQKGKIA